MYNIFGDYIHRKRTAQKLSLRKFGELCGLSHTHIDSIEKGIDYRNNKQVRPTNDTVLKIANALKVNKEIMFLLSLEQTADNFEFYYDEIERNNIISENQDKVYDDTLHPADRDNAIKLIFKAYYSKSIENCNFDINHVKFSTYVSMLLNQQYWKNKLPPLLYQYLTDEYGTLEGLPDGELLYFVSGTTNSSIKKPINNMLRTPEEEAELNEYLEAVHNDPNLRMMFSLAKDAKKEDVEKAVAIIKALLGKE